MATAPFELQAGEEVKRNEFGVWIRGGLKNQMGRVYLTNKRVLFYKQGMVLGVLFGLLGVLLQRFIKPLKDNVAFEFTLKDISHYEHGSFGFNKKVILFRTQTGEEYTVGTNKAFDEWDADLKLLRR